MAGRLSALGINWGQQSAPTWALSPPTAYTPACPVAAACKTDWWYADPGQRTSVTTRGLCVPRLAGRGRKAGERVSNKGEYDSTCSCLRSAFTSAASSFNRLANAMASDQPAGSTAVVLRSRAAVRRGICKESMGGVMCPATERSMLVSAAAVAKAFPTPRGPSRLLFPFPVATASAALERLRDRDGVWSRGWRLRAGKWTRTEGGGEYTRP